jgi:putative oxidoreductase
MNKWHRAREEWENIGGLMATGLLIARLILGLVLASHGAQKLFGWFGGYGIKGTGGYFESVLGYRPGALFAAAAGLAEFGGGLLTALGLLNPIGPALIVMVMLVAALTVHIKNGWFAANNGYELPMVYLAGALAFAFAGSGDYSLDNMLGLTALSDPTRTWIVLAVAVVLTLINVAVRRAPAPTPSTGT